MHSWQELRRFPHPRVRCRARLTEPSALCAIVRTCDCTLRSMMRWCPSSTAAPGVGSAVRSSPSSSAEAWKTRADGKRSSRRSGRSPTTATRGTTTRPRGFVSSGPVTCGAPADMARVLLDSTVLIDALRGRAAAQRVRGLRRSGDEPWVCAISVEEIWRGARSSEAPAISRLFRGLRCAPMGVAEGQRAGLWRRDLAAAGLTVHQADCLIAAAAHGIDARLATGNPSDFPMPGVTVDHWPVGE